MVWCSLIEHGLETPTWLKVLAVLRVGDALVHFVNLFEADFAGLKEIAVDKHNGNDAECALYEEDFGADGC